MPKYLIEASYTSEGVGGVAQKGGSARREAVSELIAAAGGRMECFYFGFGDADAIVIVDLPSDEVAAAVALSINRTSTTKIKTTVLLTPEQLDEAAKALPDYRQPGG